MLEKNVEKEARKNRKMWYGYYSRIGPGKKDILERNETKHKKRNIEREI